MSLIEGIGDEVIFLAAFLVVATTLIAAWLSTHVRDRPGPQQVVIQTTITTVQGRPQQTSGNVSEATEDQAGVPEGGGSGTGIANISVSASSGSNQEATDDRTSGSASDSANQVADVSGLGAQSEVQHRTSELLSEAQANSDEVDNSTTKSGGKSDENNVDRLGQTVEESGSNEEGISTNIQGQRSSDTLNENVLRNRQTGQVYPTLPSFTSETTPGAASAAATAGTLTSSPVAEEQSGVEDVGSVEDNQTREGSIRIRVKFSNDQERIVQTHPEETLGQFRRQNFVDELESGKLVRFIANGQFLADDTQTLASLNLANNSVLHCHVTQGEPTRQGQQQTQEGDLDLGHFMVPLFSCILAFVWYLRWQYRYMFNATSTLSLIGVTVLFFLAVLAAWRG